METAVTLAPPAVVVRTRYAGSEPVPFAKVQVFAPSSQEYQNARTDRTGGFSFVPDAAGEWRVVIDDEEGHRVETKVEIPGNFEASGPAAAAAPPVNRFERALLGLAVLFGATGFLYGFKSRRRGGQ
mgnify:CR=1 FL=1